MKKFFSLILLVFVIISCSKPFPYKYQDKEQVIDCPNFDLKLMNEALYSFKDDISRYYLKEIQEKDYLNFPFSYAQYIYKGAEGSVFYDKIASPHTLKVFNELVKQEDLFIKRKGKSNLNYHNGFVKCLINKIRNEEMRNKISNLIDVNFLSPEVMAENYRITTTDVNNDANFLMFIALDTFYQRLLDLDFPKNN